MTTAKDFAESKAAKKKPPRSRQQRPEKEAFVPLFFAGIKRPKDCVLSIEDRQPMEPETFWE